MISIGRQQWRHRSREPRQEPAPGRRLPLTSRQVRGEAQPFFERAVAEAEKGDVHGCIDHESLALTLGSGETHSRMRKHGTQAGGVGAPWNLCHA
jgi:hypothetical protein